MIKIIFFQFYIDKINIKITKIFIKNFYKLKL